MYVIATSASSCRMHNNTYERASHTLYPTALILANFTIKDKARNALIPGYLPGISCQSLLFVSAEFYWLSPLAWGGFYGFKTTEMAHSPLQIYSFLSKQQTFSQLFIKFTALFLHIHCSYTSHGLLIDLYIQTLSPRVMLLSC